MCGRYAYRNSSPCKQFDSRDSIVSIVTWLGARRHWVRTPARAIHFCILQSIQTCCGDHPVSCSMGSSPGVKRPGREIHHALPSSTEVKNEWNYTSALPVCLLGLTGATTFTFCLLSSYTSKCCTYSAQLAHYCLRHSDIQRFWEVDSMTAFFRFDRTFISTTGSTKWTEAARQEPLPQETIT
jgi:hypothetical protein